MITNIRLELLGREWQWTNWDENLRIYDILFAFFGNKILDNHSRLQNSLNTKTWKQESWVV